MRSAKSPYDGDWTYWATKMGKYPQLPRRAAKLLKLQRGRCERCGLYFKDEDLLEVDHITARRLNDGKDMLTNWQLLHRHCHDAKTAQDYRAAAGGASDKGQTGEEPDEAKVSRPVLKGDGGKRFPSPT